MANVMMIVFNSFEYDARVARMARALAQADYRVTVFCDHREGLSRRERRDGYDVLRVDHLLGGSADGGPPLATTRRTSLAGRLVQLLKRAWSAISRRESTSTVCRLIGLAARPIINRRSFRLRREHYEQLATSALSHVQHLHPDIVHAHDFKGLLAAQRINQVYGTPYFYDAHELWAERNRAEALFSSAETAWERALESRAMEAALGGFTVCDSIADYLSKRYAIPRPTVVRNIPEIESSNRVIEATLRDQLELPGDAFLMAYVGRATTGRGLLDVLQAMARSDPRVVLAVVGYFDADFDEQFTRRLAALGLQDRVHRYGAVPASKLIATLAGADVSLVTINAVSLSYRFALPNKLLESIHAGVPVIGTDLPEISRIIRLYDCGLTVADGNVDTLLAAIERLQGSPETLAKFRRGAVKAAAELTWAQERQPLMAAYQQALATTEAR